MKGSKRGSAMSTEFPRNEDANKSVCDTTGKTAHQSNETHKEVSLINSPTQT